MALKKIGTWINSNKISLAILVAALITITLVTWWSERIFETRLRQDLDRSLTALLDINHTALHLWDTEHRRRVEYTAKSPDIVAMANTLLALPRDRTTLLAAQDETRSTKFAWIYQMGGYQGFAIIAPGDNISLSSVHSANVGVAHIISRQPRIMERLWAGESVMSHPTISNVPLPNAQGELEEGLPTMFVAAPIRDSGGKIIAIIALRIDALKEFFPILQAARISSSGESYVFDPDGNMLSESRFTQQLTQIGLLSPGESAVDKLQIKDPGVNLTQFNSPPQALNERPLTRMAASATAGETDIDLDGYRDYRGVPVIGAWRWNSEMELGMAVEQDVADAYQPLTMFRSLLYGFALFTAALLTGLMVMSVTGRATQQRSQVRLQAMLDTIVDGVMVIDEHGIIDSINPAVEKQFGYTANELIGKNVSTIIPTDDSTMICRSREAMAKRKNGREFSVEITINEMSLGNKRYFTGIIRDITEFKQTEEQLNMLNDELQMLALVAQETDNAVIVTDKEGHILWVNRGFSTLSEYALEEVQGQQFGELLQNSNSDPTQINNICAALQTGQKMTTELLTQNKSGHPYWINMEVTPIFDYDDQVKKFVILQRDITELHQVMSELQQAKEEAEEASRSKSNFLAAMSHEIRTPMNGVIGMIDVLDRSALDDDQHKLTTTIRDSAFALLGIIDDILDFSKIEAGRLDLEEIPTDLSDLIEGVGSTLQPLAEHRNVELTLFCDPRIPTLNGDPIRIRQILFNMAGNAIKFCGNNSQTGKVTVRADLTELLPDKNRARLQLVVSDNGIGMSPEVQQRLFQAFVQAENSTTRRFGGTGLGLVICRRLVEMMNGEIKLWSAEGQGSIFTIHLELELAPQQDNVTNQALANTTTLLVGFDDTTRAIMVCYLEYAGAQVMIDMSLDACAQRLNNLQENSHELMVLVDDRREALGGKALYEQLRAKLMPQFDNITFRLLVITNNTTSHSNDNENIFYLRMNALSRHELTRIIGIALGKVSKVAPVLQKATILRPAVTIAEARQSGQLILVAEDNKTNVKVILHQLALLGYAAEVANDGREALERWRNDDFALLLTDCHMPEMDGYDLARSIRREEQAGERMPIIAITADAMSGTKNICLEAGMDDYLTKPTQVESLHKKLAEWLPHTDELEQTPALDLAPAAPATQSTEEPPVEDVVNPQTLSDAIGSDDHALLADFYQDFLGTLNETIVEINQAEAAADCRTISELAHRLKSAASTTGAAQLAEHCLALERAGKADDKATVATQLPLLRANAAAVVKWIEKYIA